MTAIALTPTDNNLWLPGLATARTARLDLPVDGLRVELAGDDLGTASVTTSGSEDVTEITVSRPVGTGVLVLAAFVPLADGVAWWRPGGDPPYRIPPNWSGPTQVSTLRETGLGAVVGRGDTTPLTYAVSGARRFGLRAGFVEETAEAMVAVEIPADEPGPVTLRLDRSGDGFADSVTAAARWLASGSAVPTPSSADLGAVWSTWYVLHQDLHPDALVAQAEVAARYGFETVIIDDGWQNADTDRGYASCGDWEPDPTKIIDPAALVRDLDALGLKTMWWVGTPFVGHDSAAFRSGAVAVHHDDDRMKAATLDARSAGARAHLLDRLTTLVESTGAHGLKIDFVERFALPDDTPAPADADVASSEVGAIDLLAEILHRGRALRPDFMIEFRQPYVGPDAVPLATMLRVGDCPMSPAQNRVGIVDLRLAAPTSVVHSDPIMWAAGDSPERVAQHLLNALFSVPQISVDLLLLAPAHAEVLAFWLGFWRSQRDVLLGGRFVPTRPELLYPLISAETETDVVLARYAPVVTEIPTGGWRTLQLVNADDATVVLADADRIGPASVTVFDARGRVVQDEPVESWSPITALQVPTGGLATITRTAS